MALPALAIVLVLAGCGPGAEGDGDERSAPSDGGATGEGQADDDGLPSIVFAGDSVMRQLSSGVIDALEGQADATYLGMPTVAGNDAAVEEWAERLRADPPDLVVVQLGFWETIAASHVPYGMVGYGDSLEPLLDLLTQHTEVLWLGHPAMQEEDANRALDRMVLTWEALPERYEGVRFVDTGAAVEVDGAYHLLHPLPDGREVLVRQIDGRHLCPDGVVLLGRAVLAALAEQLPLEVGSEWESGLWRDDTEVIDARLCPDEIGEPLLP